MSVASVHPVAFGPVYSRRLGWSLGVNLVPPKTCTWNCIYCYLGGAYPTARRGRWVDEGTVLREVERVAARSKRVDYVTLIGIGEPTLAANAGRVASLIVRRLGLRVAVLSNGSLYYRGVWEELIDAEYIKATLTVLDERVWRSIHEPAEPPDLEEFIEGLYAAARGHPRGLHVEVMLVNGLNDTVEDAVRMAWLLRDLKPRSIVVNAPSSPPRLSWVSAPPPERIASFASILESLSGLSVDVIVAKPRRPPRVDPADPSRSLLEIISTHLVTFEEAINALREAGVEDPRSLVEELVEAGVVKLVEAGGVRYVVPVRR